MSKNQIRNIRPAVPEDINSILSLIDPFKKDGTTKRDKVDMKETFQAILFWIMMDKFVAVRALTIIRRKILLRFHAYSSTGLPAKGEGSRLLKHVLEKAKETILNRFLPLLQKQNIGFSRRGLSEGKTSTSKGKNSNV